MSPGIWLYEYMLYEYVEYNAIKFDYSDGELNKTKVMIRQIKQKQWLKNKSKMLYFWNKYSFPPLRHMIEGNYLEQHKKTGCNLYTLITNVRL